MEDIIEVGQPILTVLNTTLILVGLLYTIRHYRYNRTWTYIERYNSPDFLVTKKNVKLFLIKLKEFDSDDEKKEYINRLLNSKDEKDIELNLQLTRYINLFTELGVAFKAGAWSKKAIVSIANIVVYSWENMEPYIRAEQKKVHPRKIYGSYEGLYQYIKKKELHLK